MRLTKAQVLANFKEIFGNFRTITNNDGSKSIDKPARSQAWNDYVDSLHKGREVSNRALNWSNPF